MSSNETRLSKFGFNPDITWTHIFTFIFIDSVKSINFKSTAFFTLFLLFLTLSVEGSTDSVNRPVKGLETEVNEVNKIKELTLLVNRQSEMLDEQSSYNDKLIDKVEKQGNKLKEALLVIDKLTLTNHQLDEKVKALERRLKVAETSLRESERLTDAIFN